MTSSSSKTECRLIVYHYLIHNLFTTLWTIIIELYHESANPEWY